MIQSLNDEQDSKSELKYVRSERKKNEDTVLGKIFAFSNEKFTKSHKILNLMDGHYIRIFDFNRVNC